MTISQELVFKVVNNPNFDEFPLTDIIEDAPLDILNSPMTKNGRNALMLFLVSNHSDETILTLLEKRFDFDATDINGWSALHYAAMHRNATIIKRMLELGFDISKSNFNGQVPLMFAAKYASDVEVVRLLIEASADPSVTDIDGSNIMNYAMNNNKVDMLSFLHSIGVDNISPKKGLNSLHQAIKDDLPTNKIMELVHFPFVAPSEQFQDEEYEEYEEYDYEYNGYRYRYDRYKETISSAIILAAIYSTRQKVMRLLLRNGADLSERDVLLQRTPLMHAISNERSASIIRFFIEEGSDLLEEDAEGLTALALVAKLSRNKKLFDSMLEMYKQIPESKAHVEKALMLTKYNLAFYDLYRKEQDTIEMELVYDLFDSPNSSKIFKDLKKNWETLDESKKSYTNPFDLAIQIDDAKAIAEFWKNDIYMREHPKNSIDTIYLVLQYQALNCFKLLLEEGVGEIVYDYPPRSLFQAAIMIGSNKIIEFMIKEGLADSLEGRYQGSWTSQIESTVESSDTKMLATRTYRIDNNDLQGSFIKILSGSPPILLAAIFGNTTTLRVLLDAGVNINARDHAVGRTPLMWAIDVYEHGMVENLDNIKYLIQHGSDLTKLKDGDGNNSYQYLLDVFEFEELHDILTLSPFDTPLGMWYKEEAIFEELAQDSAHANILKKFIPAWEEYRDSGSMNRLIPPLAFSSRKDKWVKVTKLMLDYGSDVNFMADTGWTPIVYASNLGSKKNAHILVANGANVNVSLGYDIKITLLELVLSRKSPKLEIVAALLAGGVVITGDYSQTIEKQREALREQGREEEIDFDNDPYFKDMFISPDLIGSPALILAAQHDNNELFQLCLDAGADVNSQDFGPMKRTALMWACQNKFRYFEEKSYPLIDSIFSPSIKEIKLLMDFGADLKHIKDAEGRTGWDYLTDVFSERGLDDVKEYLKDIT